MNTEKCTHWLGHQFTAHPAGYHFCRRCGEFQAVAMSLLNQDRPDEVKTYTVSYNFDSPLRAAEGDGLASPPAQRPTEPPGGGRGSASDNKAAPEQPPQAADATREKRADPVGGGDAALTEKPIFLASERNPDTGSPPAECEETPDAVTVRGRLQKWLDTHAITIEAAVKRDGIKLGASAPTLYNLAAGKHVSDRTLENVNAALDQLWIEDETPEGEVGPTIQVEKLPSALPPITGTNPIPKPTVPPRCARTP